MKTLFIATLLLAALLSTGCVSTAPIGATLTSGIQNKTVITDLQDTAANLDQAVTVGALAADDPAPKCVHDVLQRTGVETAPGAVEAKTFIPKVSGLFSAEAILYIKAQQLKHASTTGLEVSVDCKAILGQLIIDSASGAAKLLPITSNINNVLLPMAAKIGL